MMINTRSLLCIGVALLGSPVAAQAAVLTQVGSIASGMLNPVVFNDASGSTYTGPVSYTSAGQTATFLASGGNSLERDQANVQGDPNPYLDNNFAAGTQLIAQCGYGQFLSCNAAGAVTITFSKPTFGFTLSADDFDTSQIYTFSVQVFNGAQSLGTLTASSLANNGASPAVIAAFSAAPVTSLVITDTAASLPDGNFVIGNVATVPEPASIGILAAGVLAVVGGLRRRVVG